MKEQPIVSVVVPVHNGERYLRACLTSIARQTYSFLDVIIIDDGSTDSSNKIATSFANSDSRFKVIREKNGGPSKARNRGLALATGRYLQFVDADDLLEPEAVENLVSIAEESNADLVCFGFQAFNDDGLLSRSAYLRGTFPQEKRSDGTECLMQIYSGNLGYFSWAFFYRLAAIKQCEMRYPESLCLLEDALMLNRLLRHKLNVAYLDKPLYRYRKVDNSLSHSFDTKKTSDGIEAVGQIIELCREDGTLRDFAVSGIDLLLYLDGTLPPVPATKAQRLLRKRIRELLVQLLRCGHLSRIPWKTSIKAILLYIGVLGPLRSLL
ncbi:MAG: glycosyltransferase [Bifidobacteriaceae bacterium]|nr:glycosyltransferase [Bifidobacteriaceae bacterium]